MSEEASRCCPELSGTMHTFSCRADPLTVLRAATAGVPLPHSWLLGCLHTWPQVERGHGRSGEAMG